MMSQEPSKATRTNISDQTTPGTVTQQAYIDFRNIDVPVCPPELISPPESVQQATENELQGSSKDPEGGADPEEIY